jgi:carbamoyl-phosphate synthase/aspartate carbamoyltransferase/dihydroorotase
MISLPGLVDPHVHLREPGDEYKEDWETGTSAALSGGFTAVLAMPNTNPPVIDSETFFRTKKLAEEKAVCDYAVFLGASATNARIISSIAMESAGLKMYLNQTYGTLRLENMILWMTHFKKWPGEMPIVAHAESGTLAAVLLIANLYNRSIHIAHVSREDEILVIKKARERGYKVTCEVSPHHLFLAEEDVPKIGQTRSEVRPRLATTRDRQALWDNLDVIDCFATDHAPHTLQEKDSKNAPPGFPGLETALGLFLTAVNEGRLSLEQIHEKMFTNPSRIFDLPVQMETGILVDDQASWTVKAIEFKSRSKWSPFEGWRLKGKVIKVNLRGKKVFEDGQVHAKPGIGKDLRPSRSEKNRI